MQGSLGPRQEKVSEKALSIDVFMVYSTRELGDVSVHEGRAEIHRLADNHGSKEVLGICTFNEFRQASTSNVDVEGLDPSSGYLYLSRT